MAITVNNKKPKGHAPVFRVISASNFGIHHKGSRINAETETSMQRLHSNKRKYTDLSNFTTRNHSISSTKKPAPGLIQRYKSCYSQGGIIQECSGRKGLLARRDAWSGTSQILFLHLLFSLIRFATKIMPSPQKPSRGNHWNFHPDNGSNRPQTLLTRLPPSAHQVQDDQDGSA